MLQSVRYVRACLTHSYKGVTHQPCRGVKEENSKKVEEQPLKMSKRVKEENSKEVNEQNVQKSEKMSKKMSKRVKEEPHAYGYTQTVQGDKGIYHKEIPFGNWRSNRKVVHLPTIPYVPEGFGEKHTFKSEITGESYTVEASEYALTRIAECGGIDSYVIDHSEYEMDSQFPGDLKRAILQIVEQQRVSTEPIQCNEALKLALKLEAILGFKLSLTDDLVEEGMKDVDLIEDTDLEELLESLE